jgi:hypothetical protein
MYWISTFPSPLRALWIIPLAIFDQASAQVADSIKSSDDSIHWAQHSLRRPDSILVKDTFLFPYNTGWENHIYSKRDEKPSRIGHRSHSYGTYGSWYSAEFVLNADHRFVLMQDLKLVRA